MIGDSRICLVRTPAPLSSVMAAISVTGTYLSGNGRQHRTHQAHLYYFTVSNTIMSEFQYAYRYSPLSLGSDIRLLRLMPHEDKAASIQCQLFDYSLQESGKKSHLYEALSYVWGRSEKPRSVSIDDYDMPVTENLHTALVHLRDRSIERIIWVDAVCINQVDLKEQGLQVQLMAKIFSKATRVIVWLGGMEPDSDQALEDICLAANADYTEQSKKEVNQQPILNLLQRLWFQRIWVR